MKTIQGEIRDVNFWEYYPFLQIHSVGRLYERITFRPFAFLVAVVCYFSKDVKILGAYINNKLVGLIIFNLRYRKINYLFVKKKYRGHRVADELIKTSGCDVAVSCGNSREYWKGKGWREISKNVFMKVRK